MTIDVKAQVWDVQVGSNMTDYNFTNSAGIKSNILKPLPGFNLKIGYQHIGVNSENAPDHKSKMGIFTFGIHLNYNQFNAAGIHGINQFSYKTGFLGADLNGGLNIPLFSGISVKGLLHISVNKLMHGQQMINNNNYDLMEVEQFNGLQFLNGYSVQINKTINPYVQIHIGYEKSKSVFMKPFQETILIFEPSSYSIGMNFLIHNNRRK